MLVITKQLNSTVENLYTNLKYSDKSMESTFNQLNSFFDHVYVISLPRATERHEHFKKELKGLNYSIFWGKDKNGFDRQELIKCNVYNEELAITHHRYGKVMSLGAIGCSWSHLLVYQDMLKNNYDKILILEDDIVFNRKTVFSLPKILNELLQDWDLLYFGFYKNEPSLKYISSLKKMYYHFLRFFRVINLSHKEISNRFPEKKSTHIYKSGYHDCTHAYGITASCARKMIGIQTPISFIADHLLAHVATNDLVKAYIAIPKIIDQLHLVFEDNLPSYTGE